MDGGEKQPSGERLSYPTRLALRRAFVNAVALCIRLAARLYDFGDRLIELAETHGLDLGRAWDVRRPRPRAAVGQQFGAKDFLALMDAAAGRAPSPRAPDRPVRTSVIILCRNEVESTFQCLRSVLREVDLREDEIVVVDNGSTDETARVLAYFGDLIRVVTLRENGGRVGGNNAGAAEARGKYLVFLSGNAVVETGWLDALVETAERDEEVGAVGSMLVRPDGRLHEAGGVVWRDGETLQYGRGRSPEDPRYNFAREVDYCAGASLLVRRDLFRQLGGFDALYAPIYYEDVDLCFGLRALGFRVIFQPASRVTHFEGGAAGRDARAGGERVHLVNREKFVEKWREVLAREQFARGEAEEERAADRRRFRPEVLFVNDLFPTPEGDAGSARLHFMLGLLARRSRVAFVALNKGASRERARELWRLGVETLGQADFLREARRGRFRVAVLCRPEVTDALLAPLRSADPRLKIVFDMVDAHFVRAAREHALTGDARAASESACYRELETRLARECDEVWCTSPEDARVVAEAAPGAVTEIVPTIHEPRVHVRPFDERGGLLFVGNFMHRPNVDAVHFLMREVMPVLRGLLPSVALDIVGPHAPEEVRSYAAAEGVSVRGFVPDLEPLHERARVFVAPLRFGAGVKGKIGEALARGLPVVTTSVGAEGMGLAHGRHALIADDARALAAAISELHNDRELWQRLSEGGREHVEQVFSPRAVGATIERSIRRLAGGLEKNS